MFMMLSDSIIRVDIMDTNVHGVTPPTVPIGSRVDKDTAFVCLVTSSSMMEAE